MSPYIPSDNRRYELEDLVRGNAHYIQTLGELNFFITCVLHVWAERQGISYSTLLECVGTVEMVKAEFYRTAVAPYEDMKRNANGSVSKLDRVR